jgi:hypothetical protein
MKKFNVPAVFPWVLVTLIVLLMAFNFAQKPLKGAWQIQSGSVLQTMICSGDYFTISTYDIQNRKFHQSYGGTCTISNTQMSGKIEFHTNDPANVGQAFVYPFSITNDLLTVNRNGKSDIWKRADDGNGVLTGNWRITQREQNGRMNAMTPGPRKTIKVLSATRFQWAAINADTREFFGTGGGTYTFKDGKYTEHIEFFSRDSSRVGMSLSFDGKVEGDNWHHSGLSSRGNKMSEIWSRK